MMLINIILVLVLSICLITDLKKRLIYNIITFPTMLIGLILNLIYYGLDGAFNSLLGIVVGFLLLLIPYLIKGMAAGDVKLLMAIGALKGWMFVLNAFIYISIIGALVAIVYLIFKKKLGVELFAVVTTMGKASAVDYGKINYIPYGVPIFIGTIALLISNYYIIII